MLKKIRVEQLVLGMHIKEFCGSWMEHPFWRSAFVIDDPKDLMRIRNSSIQECWIDTARGLDIPPDAPSISTAETDAQVEAELAQVAQSARTVAPQSLAAEVERAARICAQAKTAVTSMFQEARMGKAIDTGKAQQLVEEISDSVLRNPGALISLARLKNADDYTYMHSVAVCALMIALARQLQLDEETTRRLGLAGLLHDLGKAAMPMDVLNKPGKLSDGEFAIMKRHPDEGHKMLADVPGACPIALDVVLHHHEKIDGSGYPHGLKDTEISLHAKMGAVCDVYDAVTSVRPYKRPWDAAMAMREMARWDGHFDNRIFNAFVKSVGIYPVGSLVRLSSERLAIIRDRNDDRMVG